MVQDRIRALAVTAGGAPTTKQRAAVRGLLQEGPIPAAFVTDATVAWGIVTTLGRFKAGTRAFAFNDGAGIHHPLKYLQVEGFVAASVLLKVRAREWVSRSMLPRAPRARRVADVRLSTELAIRGP